MKNTTPIKMNYEFRRVYSKGKSAATPRIVLYFRPNGRDENRLGITVSTRLGKAVVRNKLKRRIREIYRLNEERLVSGADYIAVCRTQSTSSEFWELERDFRYLAAKLGALKEDGPEK